MITAYRSGTIEFAFDEATHIYTVPGTYCLATSDIIDLAGLSDYSAVPLANLEHARWRGTQLHKAIHYFEEGDLDIEDVDGEIKPCFDNYLRWKDEAGFIPIPPFEHPIVYEHLEMYIGCHLDLRGYIPGKGLYVLDAKTSYPNAGQAKKQTHLRWRMQLESYRAATHTDDAFWDSAVLHETNGLLKKAILHLHPKAKEVFIPFEMDDSSGWDAAVTMASLKLANGYKGHK